MRLTRAASYALHAVAYMASQKRDQPTASHIIAAKRGISDRFLLKVLKPLVNAEVLLSVKGPRGGYRLARPASDISVLDVLEAIDGPIRGHAPNGSTEPDHPLDKKLAHICNAAAEQLRRQLSRIKITEIMVRD